MQTALRAQAQVSRMKHIRITIKMRLWRQGTSALLYPTQGNHQILRARPARVAPHGE
jgi:hypothetical protein